MSTTLPDIPPSTATETESSNQDATTTPPDSNEGSSSEHSDQPPSPPRPLRKYSRKQLVRLSASPLVKPPDNMPELKVWFGSDNENALKKDEPPTPNTARERRLRRDAEDGDAPARPSFRAALSQPSQMGNFKHQSLRADRERDRDRDRDSDKAKIGDTTRLQDLSDRYDRDKLGLPLPNSRTNKERDPAPHLAANTRSTQALSSNAASRRGEPREVGGKKKVGEASEDWRRGAEPPRREERERARSRARESSRNRRDPSSGRRDKDRDEPRDRPPRGDRDRDDHRREKDDSRRDRDADSEDDPRRWRDDGRREERLASRRDRRDKATGDSWDASGDKRWAPGEDRDGRYKKASGGRDRKTNGLDDPKDKDDRRDKEREKEKEPAWMDTYVPSESSPGILGGQAPTGELDGIQAWKKGLKEREHKEKDSINLVAPKAAEPSQPPLPENAEKLDEIQLFKLIMKKEQETKRPDEGESFPPTATKTEDSASQPWQRGAEDVLGGRLSNTTPKLNAFPPSKPSSPYPAQFPPGLKDLSTIAAQSLLPTESTQDRALSSALETSQHAVRQSTDFGSPGNGFQPPAGSRLLALASRGPPKAPVPSQPLNGKYSGSSTSSWLLLISAPGTGLQALPLEPNFPKNDLGRPSPGFSPFEEPSRSAYILDEPRDIGLSQNQLAANRGQLDQGYGSPVEAYNGMATNKGSRFAKFFDGKVREGVPANKPPHQAMGGFGGNSPNPGQRLEQGSFGGLGPVGNGEQKTVEDLFAMLNTSSQRNNMAQAPNAPLGNNGGFNGHANAGLHPFQSQQQQQQPQHLHQQQQHLINRLEPLYDSRSDDRSFVPDGMVPGLRPIPPPNRGREHPMHFSDQEDQIHYNLQRLAQQQQLQQQQQTLNQRNLDPLYGGGPNPALFAQQGGRHGLPLQNLQQQQQQFRGGPSPTGGSLGNGPQQRLPPGLANLGGRPPHDPNQFLGLQGHPSGDHYSALQGNGLLPQQQQQLPFNNNFNVGNLNFNGDPGRGPSHLPNAGLQQLPLGNLGNPHMDPRLATHNHLMGLGGSGVGGGNRMNVGGFPQQQQGPAQSHLGMRQQQGQLPPHLQHRPPLLPHMPQQVQPGMRNQGQAQDLMALLMGGHRD